MHPLHDKDLDRLSREAAEHFEVEPGASGWANLEMRLDTELPQKKKKRRFLFWLLFITATTGGALIGILKYQPVTPLEKNTTGVVSPAGKTVSAQPNGQAQNPAGANIAAAVPDKESSGNNNPVAPSVNQQPVNGSTTPANSIPNPTTAPATVTEEPAPAAMLNTTPGKNTTKTIVKTDKNNIQKPGAKKQHVDKTPLTLNYATIEPGNNSNSQVTLTKQPKRKPAPGRQQITTAGQHKQTVKPDTDNTQEPDTKITDGDQHANANKPNEINDLSTAQQATTVAADSVKKDGETAIAADSTKKAETPLVKKEADRKQDKKVKGLELGIMAGPDLTTANFGSAYKTGYNFGLQIGYRLSNRWSVNTGIIYTKKFYKADSQTFHYKLPWNYKMQRVEGNCSMWEIPVNVRYDFSYNDKRRWFASTGLSTYLMDKEYYDIYFTYNGNPNYPPYPYDSDSNSNYFFSIWNLSAGMERFLGKHFSIQAEPYLKIPLKGLGAGTMRMTSYGVLFTLKYKPVFNSKRSDTSR
jgi:hypothetical protein